MIRFSRYTIVYILISSLVLVPGIFSLLRWGLKPSIDFTGGTMMEIAPGTWTRERIRTSAAAAGIELLDIADSQSRYTLRMKQTEESKLDAFQKELKDTGGEGFAVLKTDTVGPVIGRELLSKAVTASVLAILIILSYVAYAFKSVKFGVAAVGALVHDMLVMFGTFSLLGHFLGVEVDTLFVTAFLTTMSFSVHDTIVIFDRIREYRKRAGRTELTEISDIAMTETMGRSLVNSFTIIFMLLSLVLMGGETVRWFAAALLIGTVTGTYSSPFVATPILLAIDRMKR